MRCLDGIPDPMDMTLSKPRKLVKDREDSPLGHRTGNDSVTGPQQKQIANDKTMVETYRFTNLAKTMPRFLQSPVMLTM